MSSAAPTAGDRWFALTDEPLPVGAVHDWAVRADCGAVVVFTGTVRDHAEGRVDVRSLTYEAYEEHALAAMRAVADELTDRFPAVGRVALLHRVGQLVPTEVAVVVAVSAPHRTEAFEAARFGIDAVKASVPIWKHEVWRDGEGWGTCAHDLVAPGQVASHDHDEAALTGTGH